MTKVFANENADIRVESVITAYDGFLRLKRHRVRVSRFDGTFATLTREVIERGNSVCILPYDPRTDQVLLIRQFLIGAYLAGLSARPVHVISGMVEEGESYEAAARREAMEEAGCALKRIIRAQAYLATPGGSSERVVAFCAEADLNIRSRVKDLDKQDEEDIQVQTMSSAAAIRLLDEGAVESAAAVVALSWFARHRENVRLAWGYGPLMKRTLPL